MGLRTQLALIGLVTLALPWAGCQYLRETEDALRQGQQTLLLATGESIAATLGERRALFPERPDVAGAMTVYAHALANTPNLDGFADDWATAASVAPLSVDESVRLLAGLSSRHVYLLVDVRSSGDVADRRVEITTSGEERLPVVYRFDPVAPGPLPAVRDGDGRNPVTVLRIQGWWAPTTDGFHLEVRLPAEMAGDRLGVRVLDTSGNAERVIAATHAAGAPGRLTALSPALTALLQNYARPGLELEVADAEGWRLAAAGDLDVARAGGQPGPLARIYRSLLAASPPPLPADPGLGRVPLPWLDYALRGEATSGWRLAPRDGQAIVAAAVPISDGDSVIGALAMKESSAAILTLTNRALGRLATLTLGATLAVSLALFGYATWLSLRISRLSRAADRAIGTRGEISTQLPSRGAADEIGDLARSFSRLLARVQETNDYLRNLGARLSHELRTPLTVVTSSLDNLESVSLEDEQREYTLRARAGAERLQAILNAMSEASRTEEAVTAAEIERFDLGEVLVSALDGYRQAYPDRRLRYARPDGAVPVQGSPELIVQLLDKLMANAVEFSNTGDPIEIRLEADAGAVRLSVSNPGPPLPQDMGERIFDSLVTMREKKSGSHLGLGLYIARLVAQSHGGSIEAQSRENGGGAVFTVILPLADQAAR